MKTRFMGFLAVTVLAFAVAASTRGAQMDPLLKILVENKVITLDQANAVQAEYDRRQAAAAMQAAQAAPAPAAAPVTKDEAAKIAEEVVARARPNLGDLGGIKIGGTYFLSYETGSRFGASSKSADKTDAYSDFRVKRAYIDIRKQITPWLSVRATPDVTQDSVGDYKVRLKFAYALFAWKGNALISKPFLEVGMVHNAWLDWEEGTNRYRMQDTLFSERLGLYPSGDLGVMVGGNFGAELPKSYQDEVSKSYPGRHGSFQVGLYNGGGFAAAENNVGKGIQARVSYRPAPDHLPGFQVSLFGAWGKGNVAPTFVTSGAFKGYKIYPDWRQYQAMLSYQHAYFNLTAQYVESVGNAKGSALYAESDYVAGQVSPSDIYKGKEGRGWSFFAEGRFPGNRRFSTFTRFDYFDPDTRNITTLKNNRDVQRRNIVGLAWWMYKENGLLLDYDVLRHSQYYAAGQRTPDEPRFQLTLQIKY